MASIRAFEDALERLTPADLDDLDPSRSARILPALFNRLSTVAGRPVFGVRRPEWRALEDKLTAEPLWDAVGMPRAPAQVVDADISCLRAAHERLKTAQGTVWAGDVREGFHGGAEYTRWVHDEATLQSAADFLSAHADRVRVMPFLDGLPCSIHALVGAGGQVAVLRPCELLILRRPETGRFAYAGAATTWDPSPADRQDMRALARRVAGHLSETLGYRGAFTLDGIMTAAGFLPTEINPRYGGALNVMARATPDLHLYLFNQLLLEGQGDALLPELERTVLKAADANRGAFAIAFVEAVPDEEQVEPFRSQGVEAMIHYGKGSTGGFVRVAFVADTIPAHTPAAPWVQAAFARADEVWGTRIGAVQPAPQLR
ncbi:MAG: hypothetical protein ACI9WU_004050 [Myxococcota bacterium]|jgi:hypothetical protein